MPSPRAFACAALLATAAGCPGSDDPPFQDRGRGTWAPLEGVPPLAYHALWGASTSDLYAAGAGGIAHLDGAAWQLLEGVPATTYRAIWGRSPTEVWIGGDGALLARSLTGWQAQLLFDGDLPITDYSVVALGGDTRHEYAVVLTGGKQLLLVNQGSAWETPLWRGAGGPTAPLPQPPSLLASPGPVLVAGGGALVQLSITTDLGVAAWEVRPWSYVEDLPPVTALGGGADFWVAAGATGAIVTRLGTVEPEFAITTAPVRDVHAVFASRANRIFLAGAPAAGGSAIQACDERGCEHERIDDVAAGAPLRAIWGDADGAVLAAGDGVIVAREACGGRRCREP